ncbi:MAG: threonine synthase [Promethearchaeota archaeon]
MQFYSTNKNSPKKNFQEILLIGQAPDLGLYMPEEIPFIALDKQIQFKKMSYADIAREVIYYFLKNEIPLNDLDQLTQEAYDFKVPIIPMGKKKYILKLDQGPTSAFKDFAAIMMSRLMQYYLDKEKEKLVILVATSGDTGGAIADAYYGLSNINIMILYPKNEISLRQRKQMTSLGRNISAFALNGKFDDCQTLVKQAFADQELKHIPLTSANSINFGRILPQIVYYFYAASRVAPGKPIIFSVPSGNLGNLMGGVFAKKMGLPIQKLIVAVNENDSFPKFLKSGQYQKIVPSKACLSNAMNVGHPSNLARLIDLYGGHLDELGILHKKPDMLALQNDFWSRSVSDVRTKEAIMNIYQKNHLIVEPHGAVAWYCLEEFLKENKMNIPCISFETADPAKFPEEIFNLLGIQITMTETMKNQSKKREHIRNLPNSYQDFRNLLLNQYEGIFLHKQQQRFENKSENGIDA